MSIGSHTAPILGRVSMDLLVIDVTDIPESETRRGAWVEVLGATVTAHDLARHADTIDYEVLTRLGQRAIRRFIGG